MSEPQSPPPDNSQPVPFPACLKYDLVSGFLVFLIALPLCLGIAQASGYPPIGGVLTAIVGGILASLISNSALTIKGPAAGLIAIVVGCVNDMKVIDSSGAYPGYRMALAVGVAAAVFQILFGLLKAGKLGDIFPTAAVHGLLASIGVIIMAKQVLPMLGVTAKTPDEIRELIIELPHFLIQYNLPIAVIGLASLAIMISYPFLKFKICKMVPAQLVVLLVAMPLAAQLNVKQPSAEEKREKEAAAAVVKEKEALAAKETKPVEKDAPKVDASAKPAVAPLDPKHSYEMAGKAWSTDPAKFLINVPNNLSAAIVTPDFSALKHGVAWKWVLMFAIIASLESLLSSKAVDMLDPQKRKTDQNRDLLACGVANLIASSIGGLPMISEIVRSRANVDNGAKSRFSNMFHGLFLLLFLSLVPFVVNMIPKAALAAMLCFTGFRLAHPREFKHMWHIGREQFLVFVTTIVAVVCTDLLIGVIIGMVLELFVNTYRMFSAVVRVQAHDESTIRVVPQRAAVFSNWLSLRGKIEEHGLKAKKSVIVDFSEIDLVDHTVMEKLQEMQRDFKTSQLKLEMTGLDELTPVSAHPQAARIRSA